jgi:hypothetical protein
MITRRVTSYLDFWLLITKRKIGYIVEVSFRATPEEYQAYNKNKKDYVFGECKE